MQVKLGKTVRVGDSYNVVDNSNRSAFVLIGASVVDGLAKPIYTRAHEATKHLVTTKQLRLPISLVNTSSMSNCMTYNYQLDYL